MTQASSESLPENKQPNRFESMRFRWRMFLDKFMRQAVAFGGISIILAITLIFFYLLVVVFPIFESAEIKQQGSYSFADENGGILHVALEERSEVALRVEENGRLVFFGVSSGETILEHIPKLARGVKVVSFANADPERDTFALGLSNGYVLLIQHKYNVTFPDDKRLITPEVVYPMGEQPVLIDTQDEPIVKLAAQVGEEGTTLVVATQDKRLMLVSFVKEESLLGDSDSFERIATDLPYPATDITHILVDKDQRELYIASQGGNLTFFDIQEKQEPKLLQHITITESGAELTALASLTGGISILVGSSDGRLAQWSLVRQENNQEQLVKFREFDKHPGEITQIIPEYSRKGFIATDKSGLLGIYHTTAENTVLRKRMPAGPLKFTAISPRADSMLLLDSNNEINFWDIHNEHPEISWKSLWGKVWYESYKEPQYLWQSSSASNDFEPKFSLVPISFGTLKAAFYAMIFAVPLAIFGAIYTAQFMSPKMRQVVKPSVEIMAALPTVILGFLAGLWLAPFLEVHMPGLFLLLIVLPPGILLTAYAWQHLPASLRDVVPDGWEAALLIPVVLFIGWSSFAVSPALEILLFNGDMPTWLSKELGIAYDSRNSIIVGIAMGFAVIPMIYSIAEDALFAVPNHLVQGSLALGATRWQTLVRVVILTASPGIFSAVMIGFGRAVGETMIVLMATGNTPVMDFSIFQGMRTLSANIAVEMPEAEVDSTHYRVLFLAALVLFGFTFLFNTVAEIVRQRLRRKYSSL